MDHADDLIRQELDEGAALERARLKWGDAAATSSEPTTDAGRTLRDIAKAPISPALSSRGNGSTTNAERSTRAIMLLHDFRDLGAPRDGRPGQLYGKAHPSRDGRSLLIHAVPDGDWASFQADSPDVSAVRKHGEGRGHRELERHVKQWTSS